MGKFGVTEIIVILVIVLFMKYRKERRALKQYRLKHQ